ncbi:hypothetical protein WR25_08906 [Diploscapter pachys]|uniref:Uncharacterized protein n=1 Tax=Diploscapter pachys TaxID=2018661 RepID=A0A2A2KN00_9BILA|nr:hypothetical protein WR25_08906 [Diploscapter pachys]
MVYIGIDLGTTYSCVSIIEDGKPVAIISEDGKPTIPSVVAYCEPEILVGNPGLMCNTDVTNILYDSKRLIGWKFLHDLPNAESRQLWTFNVDTRNSKAGYVLSKGTAKEKFLKPEEISAKILKKLKANVEKYLSTKVTGAVVAVPALFQENQIVATKRAVELAGLELKYLLEEPISAAIAYNHKKKFENSKILIFDFGGGTLDISIAEIKGKNLEVKAVDGDTQLGPDPPEWRNDASVAYFKDKLYYLGGYDFETWKNTNLADLSMDGIVETYFYYQTMNGNGLKSERFQKDDTFSELYH